MSPIPKVTADFLTKLESIRVKVDTSAEGILSKIDLKSLLKNPRKYMGRIGKDFYNAHQPALLQGVKAGEKKAKKHLKS